jgi:hypothetical protein
MRQRTDEGQELHLLVAMDGQDRFLGLLLGGRSPNGRADGRHAGEAML